MNAFGMDLTTVDIWLLGTAGTLSLWLLNTVATPHVKRHRDAVVAYRLAFDDVLLNLRENPDCPLAQIAYDFHSQHLAAIDKYRTFIPFWSRRRFEIDVAHYKDAHNIAIEYGSVFAFALSEKFEVARAKRQYYKEAINRLLTHA